MFTKKDFAQMMAEIVGSRGTTLEVKDDGGDVMLIYRGSAVGCAFGINGAYEHFMESGPGAVPDLVAEIEEAVREAKKSEGMAKEAFANKGNVSIADLAIVSAEVIAALMAEGYDISPECSDGPGGENMPCIVYHSKNGKSLSMAAWQLQVLKESEGLQETVSIIRDAILEFERSICGGGSTDAPGKDKPVKWADVKDRLFVALKPEGYKNPEAITSPLPGIGLAGEVMVKDAEGNFFPLPASTVKEAGISEFEAFVSAWAMSEKTMPGVIMSPGEVFAELMKADKDTADALGVQSLFANAPIKVLLVSNEDMRYGASAILYSGMTEKIFRKVGGDYYAIPSGPDSWFIIPVGVKCQDSEEEADALLEVAKGINMVEKAAGTNLVDGVYRYHAGKLSRIR